MKTALPIAATVLLVALCLWLPSRFLTPASELAPPGQTDPPDITVSDDVLSLVDRLTLWRAFWNGADGYYSQREDIDPEALPSDQQSGYSSLTALDSLNMYFIDKRETSVQSEKFERIVYYDSTGRAIRLYHFFREWMGDWNNWTEAYIDADTMQVYYFYISSGCRANYSDYSGIFSEDSSVYTSAELWSELMSYYIQDIVWSGDPADTGVVTYEIDGVSVDCQLNWIYYESSLFDFKILVT